MLKEYAARCGPSPAMTSTQLQEMIINQDAVTVVQNRLNPADLARAAQSDLGMRRKSTPKSKFYKV
jgi:hypothetical protein